ncbi:MAG TPA: ABC-F family ATP-binding cassette domain-containing protein [Pseudonocardiaceae bacterium]|nr:ABC-F family ATP-binding cassette domain-containing protein [Pseudonocardiaceae bacterium]
MSTQLTLRAVGQSFGDRLLLDHVDVTVSPGERIGIVGENGAGKSTLLRIIAGHQQPDDGEVVVAVTAGIGYLGQTLDLPPEHTVGDAIDVALAELRAMERRLRAVEADLADATPELLAEYGDLLTAFEFRGGYEMDGRTDKAMHGLGLAHIGRDRPLGSLSGGEQARLGLACVLAAAPEVLLLDEPTNHLDDAALTWLEDHLCDHPGTVLAVSHDRVFLTRVATAILEVDADRRTVVRYGGGYDGYVDEQRAGRARWEQAYREWRIEIRQLTEYAATTAHQVAPGRPMRDGNKAAYDRHRGRVQSSISSRVQNARERLRRLRADAVPVPPVPLRFNGELAAAGSAGIAASLHDVRVGDRLVVAELTVAAGERLLVHGVNGAGKTTLLRVLAGALPPDHGEVRRASRVGYLAQEIPTTRPRRTVLAEFADGLVGSPDEHRELLCSFGLFRPTDLHVPVGALSVGQRRRLALARLLVRPVDLLLLDEPTNHLSLALVEELEQALTAYPGALVVVSHDRRLRTRFNGTRRELRAGRLVT